jgi:hypothetical protein
VDASPLNRAIPNVTHQPFRVEFTEAVYGSDEWLWFAGRVTEGSTKTYIFAANRRAESMVWHCIDRFDGIARLVPIDGALDSNSRLWFTDVTEGTYGFYQLGPNGEPDAGRGSLGYGDQEVTYQLYFPRTDWGFPNDLKQLQSLEVKTLNTDATTPVQLKVFRDQGTEESVGATITDAGVDERFWTTGTSDTAYDTMFMVEVETQETFDTDTDWQLLSLVARGKMRPKVTREVEFVVDTQRLDSVLDATAVKANLEALAGSAPALVKDPNGAEYRIVLNSVTAQPTGIFDTTVHYHLTCKGFVWVNA